MLTPSSQKNKKLQRGDRIAPGLKEALNSPASQTGKPHQLALGDVFPNPANKRELVIPLEEFMKALRIGQEDSMVYVEDDLLIFPERDELAGLGVDLDIRTRKEESFYDKIRELAQSIYQHHLIYPVECTPLDDKKGYMLETGHRRWYASHFVPGRDKIEAVLKTSDGTDFKKALRRRDENAKRQDLSLLEDIDEVADIIRLAKAENGGKVSQVKLATALSIPKYVMSYYVKIIKADLDDLERAILRDNELNELRTVADICRLEDRSLRLKAFQLYQDRGNTVARNFVQKQLEAEKEGNDSQKSPKANAGRPKKVTTTPAAAERFVSELRAKAPDLLGDFGEDSDPIAIIQALLARFEQEVTD